MSTDIDFTEQVPTDTELVNIAHRLLEFGRGVVSVISEMRAVSVAEGTHHVLQRAPATENHRDRYGEGTLDDIPTPTQIGSIGCTPIMLRRITPLAVLQQATVPQRLELPQLIAPVNAHSSS